MFTKEEIDNFIVTFTNGDNDKEFFITHTLHIELVEVIIRVERWDYNINNIIVNSVDREKLCKALDFLKSKDCDLFDRVQINDNCPIGKGIAVSDSFFDIMLNGVDEEKLELAPRTIAVFPI